MSKPGHRFALAASNPLVNPNHTALPKPPLLIAAAKTPLHPPPTAAPAAAATGAPTATVQPQASLTSHLLKGFPCLAVGTESRKWWRESSVEKAAQQETTKV